MALLALALTAMPAGIILAAEVTVVGPSARSSMHGMVVSCPRDGSTWGTAAMDQALAEVEELGVDWVQLHPWGRIAKDGTIRFRPTASTPFLHSGAAKVRAAGLGLAWAPHLGWWGSFEWRGAIDFGTDEEAWNRFFGGYRAFLLEHAALAEEVGAALLVIGVELDGTAHREREWRSLIRDVRGVYNGRITYAANWDRVEAIPFWDALDLIGIQAYFPLGDGAPAAADVANAWRERGASLAALSRRLGKRILFNEIGFPRGSEAASRPWQAAESDRREDIALRRVLLETTLRELGHAPFLEGMFWWKWVAGDDRHDRDFSMREPEARAALAAAWAGSGSSRPAGP